MTSELSWKLLLQQKISQQNKVAVLGIGQELCADDAAGVLVARHLQHLVDAPDRVLVVEAGLAPENYTGLLRKFQPNLVILVDAAHLDETPGAVRLLDWKNAGGLSASTHTMPLSLLGGYLNREIGCEIAFIGIQAANTTFDQEPSPEVKNAAQQVARTLAELLGLSERDTAERAEGTDTNQEAD